MSAPSGRDGAGTGPGGQASAPDDWSEAETWAWAEIRAGRIADFNERFSELDPKTPEGWDDTRKLGQAFLETILLDDPYRSAIPRRGVRILGAWFPEQIDLGNSRVEHELWLDRSRFEACVQLTNMKALGVLSLEGSKFAGNLHMQRLQADGDLFMRFGEDAGRIVMESARHGIPGDYAIAPRAGATAPAALAGTLVQITAETLSTIVFTNPAAPGHPTIYAAWPLVSDLRTGAFSGGSGEEALPDNQAGFE